MIGCGARAPPLGRRDFQNLLGAGTCQTPLFVKALAVCLLLLLNLAAGVLKGESEDVRVGRVLG